MSGNPLLNILALSLKDIYTDRVAGFVFPEENRDHVRKTHAEIADAIVEGDAETAERLMRDHMAKLAEFFEERYPGLMTSWSTGAEPALPIRDHHHEFAVMVSRESLQ